MALTPQNNQAFLREVDEELRRDATGLVAYVAEHLPAPGRDGLAPQTLDEI